MIKLRKYQPKDANTIARWIKDEYSLRQWSADKYSKYPINGNDINDFYNKFGPNFIKFTAIDEFERIIGHFILRYPYDDKTTLRIGFVIIDDSLRGKGIGKELLIQAIKYSFDVQKAEYLTLGVFDNNPNAYYCYRSCGFEENNEISKYICNGEEWTCIEMNMTLKKYKQIFKFS